MCESTAYVKKGDSEEKVMDNVIYVIPEAGVVHLENILGEQLSVNGTIECMRLLDHKLFIRQ